ncbi:hypothetical protein RirG_014920 [Rhizophagus irregularis DAOM 197198w]|uniref:Protein kinase domain-containing protein n=1 Tax=Rhizophagus irregularis (strain DAOM 197198w) TaxID=1432141 RepID=A0A015LFK6_RHIIW|nr:hypothetical protein RirG_014920 [Rhizophagus irregularis DAOM 197198w]
MVHKLTLNGKIIHLPYGIELIHQDLHIRNLLKLKYNTVITDMGLCKPADYNTSENNVYGILPYVAPEPKLYQAGI